MVTNIESGWLMKQLTWDSFNYINRNKTGAFENLCRVLFLRTIKRTGSDYQYNYNQAGLEIEPILVKLGDEEKWVGAQCKYFVTENTSSQYKQILDSIELAIKKYKGRLDCIYIYANTTLKPFCTDEEMAKTKKETPRIKLTKINRDIVKLVWIQQDNILDLVQDKKNVDLCRRYFSEEREEDWIKRGVSEEERTFLNSSELFDLKINNTPISNISSSIYENKVNLILGYAGTGKSILMKKLYLNVSEEFEINEADSLSPIPVLVKLRECVEGNLESLLRQRLRDYNLNNTDMSCRFIYFFDGLDEVSYHFVGNIINQIVNLKKSNSTKSIVIASRSDSNNLAYLYQFVKCMEYKINPLTYGDIETVFASKGENRKLEKLKNLNKVNAKILTDITDIFSIDLLWNIVDQMDVKNTKIEIIEKYVEHCLYNYRKLVVLPVLEPKSKMIISLCTEISYVMQKNLLLSVDLSIVQTLIKECMGVENAVEINEIVNMLMDLFFESSRSDFVCTISFKHRRLHEYFLYRKIDDNYLKKPELLRELHLLPNKEFVIDVFFKTSLKKAKNEKNLKKVLSLRLLQQYLGYSYWHQYVDDKMQGYNSNGIQEPSYRYSSALLLLLAQYNSEDLMRLLENTELSISDCINKDNCLELIELHNRYTKGDIIEFVFEKYDIPRDKVVDYRNVYSYIYIQNKMREESLEDIYTKFNKTCFLQPEIRHTDYVSSSNEYISAFYRYCLEEDSELTARLVSNLSMEQLEVLSYQLLRYENILYLVSEIPEYKNFRNQYIKRVEQREEAYLTNTLAVYSFFSRTIKERVLLKDALDKANCGNYPTWHQNIELHNLLCYLLKDEFSYSLREFRLGVNFFTHLVNNIHQLDNVLLLWLEEIKPYNFVWNNWLRYTYSNMIGTLVSKIDFDIIKLKEFLRELMKYESVICIEVVYYTILECNNKLFNKIMNTQILDKMVEDTLNDDLEYENSCDIFFRYAAMSWAIDKEKSYSLLIEGINNEALRPPYKGEYLMSTIMPGCMYFAYQNYMYNDDEIKACFKKLYIALQTLKKTTENDSPFECFKWAMRVCINEDEIPSELYSEHETVLCLQENKYTGSEFDLSCVDSEMLMKIYLFELDNAPFEKIEFWLKIININYDMDKELSILYKAFDKFYPSMYGYAQIDYIYLPVAVLLSDERMRDKFSDYLMNRAGEYGYYNIIRAYATIGKTDEGRACMDFLFRFVNMLLAPVKLLRDENELEKVVGSIEYIYHCNRKEWDLNESKCTCILKNNPRIRILWDDIDEKEEFNEEWATHNIDKRAYIREYVVMNDEEEIGRFSLVSVDGYRAKIPLPKAGTNIIKRKDYYLARLFNTSIKTLHMYIISSGLIIE